MRKGIILHRQTSISIRDSFRWKKPLRTDTLSLDAKAVMEKLAGMIGEADGKKPENYRVVPGVPEKGRTEAVRASFLNLKYNEKIAIRRFLARKANGILERSIRLGEGNGLIRRELEVGSINEREYTDVSFEVMGRIEKLAVFRKAIRKECEKFKMASWLASDVCSMKRDMKTKDRFSRMHVVFGVLLMDVDERLAGVIREKKVASAELVKTDGFDVAEEAEIVPAVLVKTGKDSVMEEARIVSEALGHITAYLGNGWKQDEISMDGKLKSLSPEAKMVLLEGVLEIVVLFENKIAGKKNEVSIRIGEAILEMEGYIIPMGEIDMNMSKGSKKYALRTAKKIEYIVNVLSDCGIESREIAEVAGRIRKMALG